MGPRSSVCSGATGPCAQSVSSRESRTRLGDRVAEHLLRLALRRAVLRTPRDRRRRDRGRRWSSRQADGDERLAAGRSRPMDSLPGAGRVLVAGAGGGWAASRRPGRPARCGPESPGSRSRRTAATPEPTWLTGLAAEAADSLLACLTGFTAAPPAPPRPRSRRASRPVGGVARRRMRPRSPSPRRAAGGAGEPHRPAGRSSRANRASARRSSGRPSCCATSCTRDSASSTTRLGRWSQNVYAPRRPVPRRRRRSDRTRVRAPFAPLVARAPGGPPVSVVIPSFNRRDDLLQAPRAHSNGSRPHRRRSRSSSSWMAAPTGVAPRCASGRRPFACRVLDRPNSGVAASRNAGIRAASHDVVVNLDDDMVPAPGFVAAHASAHRGADPAYVAVGRAVTQPRGRADLWSLYQRVEWEDHYRRKAEPEHGWSYFDFSVGNTSLRRGLLDRAGWFDETMRRHDDQECGVRLVGVGARFGLHEDALAWHLPSAGLASGPRADPPAGPLRRRARAAPAATRPDAATDLDGVR